MEFLFNDDSWGRYLMPIMVIFASITYAVFLNFLLKRNRRIRLERKKNFLTQLEKAFESNTIENLDDIILIFEGSTQQKFDINSSKEFLPYIKELFVKFMATSKFNESKIQLKQFICELDKNEPFNQINEPEKSLLKDTLVFIKNKNEIDSERKVMELSNLVLE